MQLSISVSVRLADLGFSIKTPRFARGVGASFARGDMMNAVAGFLEVRKFLYLGLLLGISGARGTEGVDTEFFFRDGDRVVFLGDSITEPANSNAAFIEAYTLARFPNWKMSFRNVAIAGDTSAYSKRHSIADLNKIAKASGEDARDLVRRAVDAGLTRDVLPLEPTAVTINFGMNDGGWGAAAPGILEAFCACQTESVKRLLERGTRVAVISPRAVERGPVPADSSNNRSLANFCDALSLVVQSTGARYVNAFDPLLRVYSEARKKNPEVSVTGGDGVHPGGTAGHLVIAWAFLKGLGAPALVSSASIDARTMKVLSSEGCSITDLSNQQGTIRFQRLDQALPLPIPEDAMSVSNVVPLFEDLSQYTLTVVGLSAPSYDLVLDGAVAGRFDKDQLEKGVNLTGLPGRMTDQCRELFQLVVDKNSKFKGRWRDVQIFQPTFPGWVTGPMQLSAESEAALKVSKKQEIAKRDAEIAAIEIKIDALRKPKPVLVELRPVEQK